MIKLIKEDFGDRSQFTISVSTPKENGGSRLDEVKNFVLKFWKEFVYSPDSDILDDLGVPITGTTGCKCDIRSELVYLYPYLDLTDVENQDLAHAAFELNKTNITKEYEVHFGYGWSPTGKSFYIQLWLPENLKGKSRYSWGPIGTESVGYRKPNKSTVDSIKQINEDWVSTICPVYSTEHYKLIENFIKELIDEGYLVSTSIRPERWNPHFERDRKRKQRVKQDHPEWFEEVEPVGAIEFYCRDFDRNYNSKAKKKIISYALGLKDKL